jgi:hypothetical protein
MSLFVDTSVWYAAADSSDISNARAKAILAHGEPLVTTDHVLAETWALLLTASTAAPPNNSGTAYAAVRPEWNRSAPPIWSQPGKLAFPAATRIFLWLTAQASPLCVDSGSNVQLLSTITLPYFALARNVATPLSSSAEDRQRPKSRSNVVIGPSWKVRGEIELCNFAKL